MFGEFGAELSDERWDGAGYWLCWFCFYFLSTISRLKIQKGKVYKRVKQKIYLSSKCMLNAFQKGGAWWQRRERSDNQRFSSFFLLLFFDFFCLLFCFIFFVYFIIFIYFFIFSCLIVFFFNLFLFNWTFSLIEYSFAWLNIFYFWLTDSVCLVFNFRFQHFLFFY